MGEDNICKDFQRNICFRGDRCKFEHPRAPGEDVDAPMKLTFCGQFQGGQCTFRNCHYIHAEKVVEQDYRKYGTLPPEVTRDVIDQYNLCMKYLKGECEARPCKFKHTNLSLDLTGVEELPPKRSREPQSLNEIVKKFDLCKDYINERCHRGDSCKFSHASPQDCGLDQMRWNDIDRGYDNSGPPGGGPPGGPPDRKRRMMDDGYGQQNSWMRGGEAMGMRGGDGMGMGGGLGMPPTPDDYLRLQRENEQLRMENSDLRREMDGLKATNKFLLDETANMRLAGKTGGSSGTPAPGMAGTPAMAVTAAPPGMSSAYGSMAGGYSMSSGYGTMPHQPNQGMSYGGAVSQYGGAVGQHGGGVGQHGGAVGQHGGAGQPPKPDSRFSQGREGGNQMGGRW